MEITVRFLPKNDYEYIEKLNLLVDEHNAVTGNVLAVGEALAGKAAQFDQAVATAEAARDDALLNISLPLT